MNDEKKQALKAADAYFAKIGASPEWPEALRSGFQPGERNPLLPVVFADGWLTGFHARDEEIRQFQATIAARNLEGPTVEQLQRQVGQLADRLTEVLEELVRERARAEAAKGQVHELSAFIRAHVAVYGDEHGDLAYALSAWGDAIASTAGEPLNQPPTLTDPAASEAMREIERADGGGEEPTGETSGP